MSQTKLAISGGSPVRSEPMPNRIAFGDREVDWVNKVIQHYRDREIDPPYSGPFEKQYCNQFAEYMGGGYVDAVTSGTAAIYTSLQALRLKKGSEVLITAVTDSGPLNCIIQQGLTPKIVDTAKNSYNPDLQNFVDSITDKTKCIIATHAAGEPVHNIDKLYQLAFEKGIYLIEDCSQSPGAIWKNKKVGNFSHIAAFSTMYRKTLQSGGNGGLVFTRCPHLFHMLEAAADKGKQVWRTDVDLRDPNFSIMPAINFTTNDISCAIGIASLERLDETIKQRNKWVENFIPRLSETKTCFPYNFNNNFSVFYFPIFVDVDNISCSKRDFAEALIAEGVGLQPHYGCVVSDWEWAKDYMDDYIVAVNATEIRDNSFNLFVNEKYGDKEIDDIIESIKKVESHFIKDKNKKGFIVESAPVR